jgi:hypothetical protein
MLMQQIRADIQFRLQFYDTNAANLKQSSETLINKGKNIFFKGLVYVS